MANAKTKKCSKCGKRKRRSAFHRRRASRDGREALCKDCRRAYDHARNSTPAARARWRARYATEAYRVWDRARTTTEAHHATRNARDRKRYATDKAYRDRRAGQNRRRWLKDAQAMLDRGDGLNCWLCLQPLDDPLDPAATDHYIPVSAHGPDAIGNLHAAHRDCNRDAKRDSIPRWGPHSDAVKDAAFRMLLA